MNQSTPNTSNWNETKSKIKARFGKLTDDSIESAKNDLDVLTGKLQMVYGYGKEQAVKELASFRSSLTSTSAPTGNTESSSSSAAHAPVGEHAKSASSPAESKPAVAPVNAPDIKKTA